MEGFCGIVLARGGCARQRQADDLAAEAFQSALASASGPVPDVEGLRPWLRLLGEAGDETRMMEVLLQSLKIEPDHPLLLAQYTTLAAFTRSGGLYATGAWR